MSYRWKADELGFKMLLCVGKKDKWQIIQTTADWQTMPTSLQKDEFDVATDLYFIDVVKQ